MLKNVTRGAVVAVVAALLVGSTSVFAARARNVDARRPDGSTPLQWATFAGDIAEVKRLIANGADVRAANNYGINAMLLAADIASTELIELLLKNGANANTANPDGETALHLVARAGNVEAAKLLLKAGAKVDPRDKFGEQTPLMWAVARRQPAMVELLLSHGSDANARSAIRDYQRVATAESRAKSLDRGGFTPLLYAARENCRECVEILIRHGVDLNKSDPSHVVPLVIAMINGNFDIAKRLVEAGADVNQWDTYGQAPLHVAIAGGGRSSNPLDIDFPQKATSAEITQMLIERGANPNQQVYYPSAVRGGFRGTTPFLVAVGTGNLDLVKQLIAKGANVKLANSEGQGAIHAAVQARGGGGPRGGGPPAGGAPRNGGAAGADDADADGDEPGVPAPVPLATPRAAVSGVALAVGAARPNQKVELIKYLAAQGADVHIMAERNWRNRTRGGSALHYAVRGGGDRQVIQALVDLGLDINQKDEDGVTALDYAMGRGMLGFQEQRQPPNKPLSDFLRSLGANVELDRIPDWPRLGAPLSTFAYDSIPWPVDPKGP
ncbi:MAG: ankyrin repeat domain-containing protein [Pseudomonadota bacterium]